LAILALSAASDSKRALEYHRFEVTPIAKIEIFGPTVSPFVVKVLAAADYKRLNYTHQDYLSLSELSKLNPETRKVPFVLFDGALTYDSTVILERFDQLQQASALVSDDSVVAAQQRLLEDWTDESFYWYMMAFRWNKKNEHRTIEQNSVFVPKPVRVFAKPLLRLLIGRMPKAQGLGRLPYSMLITEFGKRLDDLVVLLGEKPFFYADRPSVADFSIFGVFSTGCSQVTPDFAEQVSLRSPLVEWRARVEDAISR
jgi:glutathione S-transferase